MSKISNGLTQVGFIILLAMVSTIGCGSNGDKSTDSEGQSSEPNVSETSAPATGEIDFTTVRVADPIELENLKAEEGEFLVKGTVNNKMGSSAGMVVVLQQFVNGQLSFIDTTRTDEKGRYKLTGSNDGPDFYYVTFNSQQPPGTPVILEAGKEVEMNFELGDFIDTKVKGDAENQKLKELYDLYISHNKLSKAFSDKVQKINPQTASDSMKMVFNQEYSQLQVNMQSDIEKFVQNNKGHLATFFAVTYVLPEPSMDILDVALAKMKKDLPNSEFTAQLDQRISSVKPLEVGGLAPEIALQNPDGEIVKLSSLRGKVVLIDFWASWCKPCRAENPNVVRVYNKYHDQGFEIYSVSLDNNPSHWKNAIQSDGLTWTHVSDLKGWKSSAAALYKVNSIPKTFLLDKKGRVIASDLRGQQLEAKLSEIFN